MSDSRSVADLGEFGLIDRIADIVGPADAVVGIGDDTAVLDAPGEEYLLATVDMLVSDVHFRGNTDGFNLGRRALAVNLSDIAAMGGVPTYALISVALPADTPLSFVDDLYRGLRDEAARYSVSIVGGNITRTDGPIAVDVVQMGRVPKDEVVLRRGAQVGDVLVVTGVLGAEAASRLAGDLQPDVGTREATIPCPAVEAGRRLASRHLAHAMMDLSDGLGSDVHHLAARSEVGAVIYEENLPVAIQARNVAGLGSDPRELALYGGEDFTLLAAIPEKRLAEAREAVGQTPLYAVGTVLAQDQGVLLERIGGAREPLPPRGWSHF